MPAVPSVSDLRQKVSGWLRRPRREPLTRTILIVDSHERERAATARLVESLGYTAVQTHTAAEALQDVEEHDPEFVLLGFDLDDATGLETLARLREVHAEVPVIMLAADLWDTRVAEAMRRGAVAYLARPFGQDDLRELLGRS